MGGYFGAELKYASYDGVIVQGQSDTPLVLIIEDDNAHLEPADDLWGQGTLITQQRLKDRYSPQHQIAAIGPAGENKVRFASIIHRVSNAVGNGGLGGVMGAKRLKAIVVRGTRGVSIAHPQEFLEPSQRIWQLARGGLGYVDQIREGYPMVACTHGCSVRCGTNVRAVTGELTGPRPAHMLKCNNGAMMRGSHPAYQGVHVDGHTLDIPRPPGFGDIGLDLASYIEDMGLTSWCYDTWYRYLGGLQTIGITEIMGELFHLDDPSWWRDWLHGVAHRQGAGDAFAEGLARFYDAHPIGPEYLVEFIQSAGSRGHSWHRDGRAMERHPSPFWEYSALLYAVSTRDVTPSTHGFFFLNGLYGYDGHAKALDDLSPGVRMLIDHVYGSEKAITPGMSHTAHVTAWHQERAIIKDSLGVCDWVYPVLRATMDTKEALEEAIETGDKALVGDLSAEAALYQACTGMDLTIDEMERPIAERTLTLERCLEVRNHGRCRVDDEQVISHYQWSEKTDGTHLSESAVEFHDLLDRYYDLRGWDRETGIPTESTLRRLGLEPLVTPLAERA